MKNYSWLASKFVDDGIGLIINGVRFDGAESGPGHSLQNLEIRVTLSALSKLQKSEEWNTWQSESVAPLKAEDVYGPNGKLGWLWPNRWSSPNEMLGDFCTNMGGGVPIEVIREIVDICFREATNR